MQWARGFSGLCLLALAAACSGRSIRHESDGETGGNAGVGGPSGGTSSGTGGSGTGGTAGTNGSTAVCASQPVLEENGCHSPFAYVFLGTGCAFIETCRCVNGCAAFASSEACEEAHLGCVRGCGPEDAQWIGDCNDSPSWVFTGANGLCVAMSGCECMGSDCGIHTPAAAAEAPAPDPGGAPAIPNPCTSSYVNCLDQTRPCDEIQAAYEGYLAKTACALDSDCQVVPSHCSIGLGGCSTVMNAKWPAAGLEALAEEWTRAGCAGDVFCDCPAGPTGAVCEDGRCVGVTPL
jgi:hypothetical protein